MQIKSDDLKKAQLAIQWLAARCDHAATSDGQGFSGTDAVLGHALAEKEVWSPRELLAALGLIVKYKKQVSKGDLDILGLDAVHAALATEPGEKQRISKREMATGEIFVVDNSIILKTSYNRELIAEIRELIGRTWDGTQNACSLCAENAAAVEDIAARYGLKVRRHKGWEQLLSTRSVEYTDGALLIHGVNAGQIAWSFPKQTGRPETDEKVFRSVFQIGGASVGIALKSWIIREALLWLTSLDKGEPNFARLSWARNDAVQILGDAYAGSLQNERSNYSRASAVSLSLDAQATIAATLPAEVVNRLMPHQWVAIQVLLDSPQAVLADQQGLGKTIEILATLESASAFPAIVLAPATALLNWRDEIASWLPHRKVSVLGGGIGKRDQGVALDSADIVVINYESFSKNADALAALHPRALVADEAQYLKGHDSIRTKAVKEFCKTSGVKRIIAATGTPVMNRPSELLTLLTLLPDLLAELGGFERFASRYCRATLHTSSWSSWWDYGGAANLGELANRMRETGRFVRREKAFVLPDLRAKQHEFQKVEISNRPEYSQAADDFKNWLKTQISPYRQTRRAAQPLNDEDPDGTSQIALEAAALGFSRSEIDHFQIDRAEGLRRMTALRQLAGMGKVHAAVQWIERIVKDEKLIVFAFHIEVQEALVAALTSALGPPLAINGEMTAKARREAILQFQNDPAARIIVCSLKAAQTAITLTAAQRVLMVELDWTPAALEQAEDRAHRVGQLGQVSVTYLCASVTLDDRMEAILSEKRIRIDALTSSAAKYGYRKDGAPRQQLPGPGRPRLDAATRAERRKSSKSGWQARNTEYMRDYMRTRRLEAKIKTARNHIDDYKGLVEMGIDGMRRATGVYLRQSEYQSELDRAQSKAESAQKFFKKIQPIVKD
jgi:superfamily II DNA/RNA helicase